ncbi:MAG: putative zinc-binding protein [Methanosarcina sp.]|jgi:uncharacterized metal-binding protein
MSMRLGKCDHFPLHGSNKCRSALKIAIGLEKKGVRNLKYTSGIETTTPGIMKVAEASDRIIAIDGCPVKCAN